MSLEKLKKASRLIEEHQMALAEDAVTRQYEIYARRWETYGTPGREKSVRDMSYHLDYLVEALALADPTLFTEYAAWVKVLFANLGFADEVVVNTLDCLKAALIEMLPDDIASEVVEVVEVARNHAVAAPTKLTTIIDPTNPQAELAEAYLDLLLAGSRHEASRRILDAVEQGTDVRDIYINVFQPAQREVGRLWQMNQISVAQEHYCTAATQLVMSQLYPHIFTGERKARRFMGMCVGGELHEMGVRMVADFFEMDGWDSYYLGANTPPAGVLASLRDRPVDVVGISATMTFHVRRAASLIEQIRAADLAYEVKVLVGGYPFNIAPDLWQEIGADGYAVSAELAVDLANQLV